MPQKILQFRSGLKPHKHDHRDYSHHKTFGAALLSDLPDEYLLVTDILNQGGTEKCTAYASCAIAQAKYGKKFSPDKYYAEEGVEYGLVSSDGYDLRTTMKTAVDIGFPPLDLRDGSESSYKQDGYFYVDGPYDTFDNLRSAMWLAKSDRQSPLIGLEWYREWTYVKDGIISDGPRTPAGLHAVRKGGWTKHKRDGTQLPVLPNNDPYLAVPNSYGEGFGDKGWFYFPRSIVNKEWVEGRYMWLTKPPIDKIETVGVIAAIISSILKIMRGILSSLK